jgi:fibronectin type III domain protein/NHL repeat-containing protein
MGPLRGRSGVAGSDVRTVSQRFGVTLAYVRPRVRRAAARVAALVGACATLGLIASAPAWALPFSPVITDFAGISGSQGSVTPGPATGTTLGQGYGVAVDVNGNVYIADYVDSLVEKVTPDGTLSIVAGVQGSSGAPTPGPATSSDLDEPKGVAIAPNGDLYIADDENSMVEKVTPDGTLSVIAGDGNDSTPTPGPATSSPLGQIRGVAVDQAGNLYIADPENNVIEKVTADETLSIFAGTPGSSGYPTPGPAADSTFDKPSGVAVDSSGNVYIADYDNSLVEKVTPSGTLSIFAGIPGSGGAPSPGLATAEPLNGPRGVATDPSGDVYIADYSASLVEKVTPDGMLSIVAGDGTTNAPTYGAAAVGSPSASPFGVAAEPDGTFFTADGDYLTVDRIGNATPGPTSQPTLAAGDGSAHLSFTAPTDPGTSTIIAYQVSLDGGSTWQTISTTPGQGGTLTATLTALSDGTTYNVLVRAVNGSGGGTASPQASVTPQVPPANSTPPTLTGTPEVGDTLTADPGTWQGTSLTYSYQWLRDGIAVSGATNTTYVPTSNDVGHQFSVQVTASNDVGSVAAASTNVTAQPAAPSDSSVPTITGTTTQGQTLTAGPGTWSDSSAVLTYEWKDCDPQGNNCVAVAGATSSTYTLGSSDVGDTIVVVVTATNAAESSSASSTATSIVTAPSSPTPAPTPTPTPVPLSLGAVPSAGITVTNEGRVMLALNCPTTPTGCDASGVLIIHLPKTTLPEPSASRSHANSAQPDATVLATDATVLASFSGQHIAGGHSALIAVSLNRSVLRRLQTLRIRRVKVTLTLSDHLSGGSAVTTTNTVYLKIPPLGAGACPVATGQLTATTLGPVTLGGTRAEAQRLLPGYTKRNYHTDNFCLYDGSGIRVGYGSAELLGSASAAYTATIGSVILALTANPYYILDGIRPGSTLATASHHLHLSPAVHTGRNDWYIIPGTASNDVLKVRRGVIKEIGIATKGPTSTRAQQLQLLRNF